MQRTTLCRAARVLGIEHPPARVYGLVVAALTLGSAAFAGISCRASNGEHVEVRGEQCVSCHRAEYLKSSDPPHQGLFATTCSDCHDERAWSPSHGFDHESFFALTGAHSDAACSACHVEGYEQGQTSMVCVDCHRSDYDDSTFPGHDAFPTTCADCHTTSKWSPATGFEHDRFPLEGAHAEVSCKQCHTQGFEPGQTPKDCVGCHREDYDDSPFPSHDTFATTCQDCHGTTAWKPASIPDHDQFFPLDGAHTGVACASCHTNGYAPGDTPNTCVGCHQADYDRSPYPGHSTFPTTCNDCHTTTAWKPASGGHPEATFPIKSGAHKVVTCAGCHNASISSNAADNPDCVGCHTGHHTRAKMDDKHDEVRNYPAGDAPPNFCLDCHPKGRNDD